MIYLLWKKWHIRISECTHLKINGRNIKRTDIRMVKYLNVQIFFTLWRWCTQCTFLRLQSGWSSAATSDTGHTWGERKHLDSENQKKFSFRKDVKNLASPSNLIDYVFFCYKSWTRLWVKASKNKLPKRPDNRTNGFITMSSSTLSFFQRWLNKKERTNMPIPQESPLLGLSQWAEWHQWLSIFIGPESDH